MAKQKSGTASGRKTAKPATREMYVDCLDPPGMMLTIVGAIAENGVNIDDSRVYRGENPYAFGGEYFRFEATRAQAGKVWRSVGQIEGVQKIEIDGLDKLNRRPLPAKVTPLPKLPPHIYAADNAAPELMETLVACLHQTGVLREILKEIFEHGGNIQAEYQENPGTITPDALVGLYFALLISRAQSAELWRALNGLKGKVVWASEPRPIKEIPVSFRSETQRAPRQDNIGKPISLGSAVLQRPGGDNKTSSHSGKVRDNKRHLPSSDVPEQQSATGEEHSVLGGEGKISKKETQSREERDKMVLEILGHDRNFARASNRTGWSEATISRIARKEEVEGQHTGIRESPEMQATVLKAYDRLHSFRGVARELGNISHKTVAKIVRARKSENKPRRETARVSNTPA
jgi:hypothetical protein